MGFAAAIPIIAPLIMQALYSASSGAQSGDDDVFGIQQQSLLSPQQRKLEKQRFQALQGPGAGGAFGDVADYWRDLMSPNSQTAQEMGAPMQRQFQEQTIPDLAEQFAGMGSGGLSSSGFRNAGISAGTDLSERLGALRAQLKAQGASSLANLGSGALVPTVENLRPQPQASFGENLAQGVGQVAPQLALQAYQNSQQQQNIQGPQNQLKSQGLRNTGPYGTNQIKASPQFSLPNRSF
jgi:hypothetical protein